MLLTKIPILLPSSLLTKPGKAIKWRMSQADCLRALGNPKLIDQSEYYLIVALQLDGYGSQPQRVNFMFDNDAVYATAKNEPGLWRIESTLHKTQNFLDEPNYEAIDALTADFQHLYDGMVASYADILGQPDFIGNLADDEYPDDQAAWQIAFWNRPNDGDSRFQVELDHPDRESPLTIKIACYRPSLYTD